MLLTELNYFLLFCAILCKIFEMAGVEAPINRDRTTSTKDIFSQSLRYLRTNLWNLIRRHHICNSSRATFPLLQFCLTMILTPLFRLPFSHPLPQWVT